MAHITISLRIPEELAGEIKTKAAHEYSSISQIVRQAIARDFRRDALRDRKPLEAALGEEPTTAILGKKDPDPDEE